VLVDTVQYITRADKPRLPYTVPKERTLITGEKISRVQGACDDASETKVASEVSAKTTYWIGSVFPSPMATTGDTKLSRLWPAYGLLLLLQRTFE